MIRNSSKRMTVAPLKKRIDHRFREVDKRFDAVDQRFSDLEARLSARIDVRFESISDKLDSIASGIDGRLNHQANILDEHEERLKELEAHARLSARS